MITKTGASLWKIMFSGLTDAAKKRIWDAKIPNSLEREVEGINRGTANILKQNNAMLSPVKGTDNIREHLKNNPSGFHTDTKFRSDGVPDPSLGNDFFASKITYPNLSSRAANAAGEFKPNATTLRGHKIKVPDEMTIDQKNYALAAALRHEAYEARSIANDLRKQKLLGNFPIRSQRAIIRKNGKVVGSHDSLKILADETKFLNQSPWSHKAWFDNIKRERVGNGEARLLGSGVKGKGDLGNDGIYFTHLRNRDYRNMYRNGRPDITTRSGDFAKEQDANGHWREYFENDSDFADSLRTRFYDIK